MASSDPLSLFLPPVREWFRAALGRPTAPQLEGWPLIASGQNTLILAPTGSGKTLAAFLACLDHLWRQESLPRGVQVLYISPLKALNNDIAHNLQLPLVGVTETAERMGWKLPHLEAAVRTGDTPQAERQRLIRKPPHILITTPESLHLMLTSRARDTLRGVTHVIIDEIHALCPNKRGVFLALLLERLQAINSRGFVRIGLSATQRPLDEVARFLGGAEPDAEGRLVPRPVAVVDAGLRKNLDLRVLSPVEAFGPLPEGSVWPPIYRLLGELIREHRSTIVFTNDRRSAERITSFLNDEGEVARAHHGSVALEVRQQVEAALKEGRLPAVVATASLELGIDMGAVDLVCQVGSPGNVARALQRVGRAGHLVGQTSMGRLIPKTAGDLLEQAVLAREMSGGRVEAIRAPVNCLDVLAQQLVALAAMDDWSVPDLYALARRAYSYRDLSPQAFETTLEMISGRYRFAEPVASLPREGGELSVKVRQEAPPAYAGGSPSRAIEALQPRVSWDRVHNRLLALPGSLHTALINGGVIPDVGQYAAYTSNGLRIGELDEEFIYESRVGDAFLLGTNAWRLERIEADRVVVAPAEGAPAAAPFWRGEGGGRTYDLGLAIGAFLREMKERIDSADLLDWLQGECFLDAAAARNLRHYVTRQLIAAGSLPTDLTLQIEASRDQLGDWQVAVLSPLGSRLHLTLRFALEAWLRQRLGYHPQCMHHSDGVLLRFTDMTDPLLDLLDGLTPENVEGLILDELADSPLFALRFRQNAARALLMPRGQPGRRAPLWLQRLRGRDLLQVCRRHPDFPVIAETFRECLHDHLDVPRLQQLLTDIHSGRVEVKTRRAETPSAFVSGLLFSFTVGYMYSYDRPEGEGAGAGGLDKRLLEQLVSPEKQAHLLDPRAIHQVDRRLRGLGQPPRSPTEAAEWLRRLGDLSPSELEGPMAAFLLELEADGRARRIELPGGREPLRWVAVEEESLYRQAFGLDAVEPEQARAAAAVVFERFLTTHALVGLADVLERYPFDPQWAQQQLEEWARTGRATPVRRDDAGPLQWSAPENLEQVQRGSLSLLRREVTACPPQQFADFLLRWQGVHPSTQKGGAEGLSEALERLQGVALPTELWEQTVLPARVPGYQPRWLDEWIAGGSGVWIGQNDGHGAGTLYFIGRESVRELPSPSDSNLPSLTDDALLILDHLRQRGASFLTDLAMELGRSPGVCRTALWSLAHRGLVTNDRFDAARKGDDAPAPALAASFGAIPRLPSPRPLRRRAGLSPEGRWSMVPWGRPEPEALAVAQASLLLQRYGIVAREMALLDASALPWRVLYEVLSRMELVGDVRRGYFVEGLSGAQFALPEAARQLQDLCLPSTVAAPVVLLHSLDPANLYGSGAPFDVALLDGGVRSLLRRSGTWLVLRAGRPVLLIEQQGRRLTALPSASRDDVVAAVGRLPDLSGRGSMRHKLTVEEWNGEPVTTTEGRELLEGSGFVRDYQSMTLYKGS